MKSIDSLIDELDCVIQHSYNPYLARLDARRIIINYIEEQNTNVCRKCKTELDCLDREA